MKIRFYLATAIVALSWMGCSQEETTSEIMSGANTIQATIESTSRSAVTEAGVFSWTAGDQITLVEETGGGVMRDTYTYSGSGDAFTPPTPTTVTTPVVAYYPAHDSHTATKFYLPDSYGSTSEEYVADTHAAMMATPPASGNTYAFMHLGGLMRFNVKNVPAGVHTFRLTIPWKQINGSFPVTENSDGEKIIVTDNATVESGFNVQIHFKALTEAKDMTFYVPLPTGTYGEYKVGLINGTTSIEHNSTGVSNTINRKTLLLMPTFTYDGTKLVKGEAIAGVIDLEAGNQSAEISADAEVMVTSGTDADATATLNYTPAVDGSSVLSLSDGSGATESGDSEGKVVVSTTSGSTVASCDINTPSLTVELLAAGDDGTVTFTEVTALTAEQTLIIGKGVTVTTLNIKGGNVVIEEGATVTTIKNDATDNTITVNDEAGLKAAVATDSEITLADSITLSEVLAVSGKVTLDLNGNTLTTSDTYVENEYPDDITVKGELSIKNGTIKTANTAILADGGKVSLTGCTIESSRAGSSTVVGVSNSTLIIENCTANVAATAFYGLGGTSMTLTNCSATNSTESAIVSISGTNSALALTGGTYTGVSSETHDRYAIGVKGGAAANISNATVSGANGGVTVLGGSTATLTGGSYSGVKACGLFVNQSSTVTYSNCTFSGVEGDVVVGTDGGTVNSATYSGYAKVQ